MAPLPAKSERVANASFPTASVLLVGKRKVHFFEEPFMQRYFFGVIASLLAVVGLAASPSSARADHHDWHHHHGWHDGHNHWDRSWYGGQGYYAPYRPRFFVQPYGYSYPNYVPYYNYNYVYPNYGFGYQGPYFSFSIGP
jgi:hypothetical protein